MSSLPEADRPAWLCRTCGVQYPPSAAPPAACAVCGDERQYVPLEGQSWINQEELRSLGQGYDIRELEPGLTGFRCLPQLGIGPIGYLVQTPMGNVLWDCPSYVDERVVAEVTARGGLAAISASHPHFYGAMLDWSEAFGDAPILLPEADREWVQRPDPRVRFWESMVGLVPGLMAVRCGGHFEGSSVLHWPAGAEGRGVLFTADTIMVAADRRWVSFMRSYPNMIPLGAAAVDAIVAAVAPLRFDRIYGNPGWEKLIPDGAAEVVSRSAARYREAITTM
ncbi:MAG TPA: hydrolase [Candidatus Dormibacteraeota bacterium]|jgi:glyoxylase-like metal-dependent hydrolase (beta-lactamase superfamily II)